MAAKKKKPVIDLTEHALTFEMDEATVKLISFNPNTMTLQVNIHRENEAVHSDNQFPFAHLPKALKQAIKPN